MSMSPKILNDTITIRPKSEWYVARDDSDLYFPELRYRTKLWNDRFFFKGVAGDEDATTAAAVASEEQFLREHQFLIGGSWNAFVDRPFYRERCAIFEHLYFPYDWPFLHLTVRNGVLLWPRINLSLFTNLRNPNHVVLLHATNRKILAEIVFSREHGISLTEYVR